MKIEFTFPYNEDEANVTFVHYSDTNMLKVTVEPFFNTPQSTPSIAFLKTKTDSGELLSRETLQVSGNSGKLRRVSSAKRVQAKVESAQDINKTPDAKKP